MVIKKQLSTILAPIIWFVPMIFILPFLLIYTVESSWAAIVPSLVCFMLMMAGGTNLNCLIRFGTKLLVIDSNEIKFCLWKVKKIAWTDIKDIRLETMVLSHFLLIQTNSREMTVNLDVKQSGISNQEIYSYALEMWVEANDGKENAGVYGLLPKE